MNIRLVAFAFVAVSLIRPASGESRQPLPADIRRALGCLVTAKYVTDNLATIGVSVGGTAIVRYRIGSVPGTGKTPDMRWIAVYSNRADRGWLFMADPDGQGRYFAVRNGYRITKSGRRWNADEGNGGLATYAAMSTFATSLANRQRFVVKLVPAPKDCTVDR